MIKWSTRSTCSKKKSCRCCISLRMISADTQLKHGPLDHSLCDPRSIPIEHMTSRQRMGRALATVFPISVFLVIASMTAGEVSAAESQSLSKITPQQITRILPLPAGVSTFDPVVECGDSKRPDCRGIEQSKKLLSMSSDGNVQLSECEQMRLFRFTGVTHLQLVVSTCRQGPYTLPELDETKQQARQLVERLSKEGSHPKSADPILDLITDARTVSTGRGETIHIFTILLVGHGIGFVPTAVVTSPSKSAFVIQLLYAPRSETLDPKDQVIQFLSQTNKAIELLAQELYPTIW
jgi:hypothetical protein